MADASIVTIRVASGRTVEERASVLGNCSPVLEGFLRDGDGRGSSPVIAMDEFDLSAVKSFLTLAKIVSHDAQGLLSMTEIVQMAPVIMPLIHKYDSQGMLGLVKSALNASPDAEGLMAVVKHSEDDGIAWMDDACKKAFVQHLLSESYYHGSLGITASEKIGEVPPKALQELFVWAMTTAQYKLRCQMAPGQRLYSIKSYLS